MPVKGSYTTIVPKGHSDGSFIFRAAYTDRGVKSLPAQSAQATILLRNPLVSVFYADQADQVSFDDDSTRAFIEKSGAFLRFEKTDLTEIKNIEILGSSEEHGDNARSGVIEARANPVWFWK